MDLTALNLTPDQLRQLQAQLAPGGPAWRTKDVAIPGGVFYNPASPEAREHAKWETTHTKWGDPGKPPYQFTPYPAMLYRPSRLPSGQIDWSEQLTVHSEDEQRTWESRGYVAGGRGVAQERLEQHERGIATAAAERAAAERRMSPQARAEAERHDDATAAHVPEIPRTPVRRRSSGKKRGRPRRVPETFAPTGLAEGGGE